MYSLGINSNSVYSNYAYKAGKTASPAMQSLPFTSASIPLTQSMDNTPFSAINPTRSTLRTQLTTNEEKQKYSALSANLDKRGKKNLDLLLRTGALLNNNSNDKSSTLDNLYTMLSTPRAEGLTAQVAVADTLSALARPEAITQTFEEIPKEYVKPILECAYKNPDIKTDDINEKSINVGHSATCVATSIEFKLAKQMPAEFARFAQELTSPKLSVDKTIQLKNLADNTLDAVWLLNAFEVPYKMQDFDKAKLTLAPDKNALIRAQIQNAGRHGYERSMVDVLMQSTFMNVGSQQAYDSLTDVRGGKFSVNDRGLIEFEKTFTESIVKDRNEISVTYQNIDQDGKLVGYETDFNTLKRQILDSLALGEGVIIGYTLVNSKKEVINGHEITITGAREDKNHKLIFTCVDTDDNNPNTIEYSEDYLIPKIHHAGLPKEVAEKDVKYREGWIESMEAYKKAKAQRGLEA